MHDSIDFVTLGANDPAGSHPASTTPPSAWAARHEYGVGDHGRHRLPRFTLSLTVSQPGTVNGLIDAAVAAGASVVKPATKSFGVTASVVRPDGAL
ncbi:hypothetical protein LV779_08300 [Streptomyces thinghirensis]|nr:hypothetical protein [Streptomyces thinghirensis]